jgi:hypothetical protein
VSTLLCFVFNKVLQMMANRKIVVDTHIDRFEGGRLYGWVAGWEEKNNYLVSLTPFRKCKKITLLLGKIMLRNGVDLESEKIRLCGWSLSLQWSSYDHTWFSESDKQEIFILIAHFRKCS